MTILDYSFGDLIVVSDITDITGTEQGTLDNVK